jgi:hypothetical protein
MTKPLFATAVALAVVSFNSVDAHSKMTVPNPNSPINDSPSGTINGPMALKVPDGMHFDYDPPQNYAAFTKAFQSQTKYKTLRDLIYANFIPINVEGTSTKECGRSAMTGPPQALPAFVEYATGFSDSHWGPCEVWCDDVRVFQEDNCRIKYPNKPAKLPYDKAKCVGAKRLQSFWLALHVADWQAYISCASLSGKRLLRGE